MQVASEWTGLGPAARFPESAAAIPATDAEAAAIDDAVRDETLRWPAPPDRAAEAERFGDRSAVARARAVGIARASKACVERPNRSPHGGVPAGLTPPPEGTGAAAGAETASEPERPVPFEIASGPDTRGAAPEATGAVGKGARRDAMAPPTRPGATLALARGGAIAWMVAVVMALAALPSAPSPAAAALDESGRWPPAADLDRIEAEPVTFASSSPFVPADAGPGAPPAIARGTFYRPDRDRRAQAGTERAPAVMLLHGAGGVSRAREETYARQLAAQGVAVLVIDVFAARAEGAGGFVERILAITESMALADAFAGLRWLAERPDVDPERVAIVGFSFGGIASIGAAYEQAVRAFGARPDDGPDERSGRSGSGAERLPAFAAHVSFYGPCIGRWQDPATTGAPVLMLWGDRDEIMDAEACAQLADDLERGGSSVRTVVYPEALHRWDGGNRTPWRASRHVADCRFTVDRTGRVREEGTGLAMTGPITRRLILAACSSEDGFLIGADPGLRERSNAELARFLNPVLFPPSRGAGSDPRD